jgi:hypothetical protein
MQALPCLTVGYGDNKKLVCCVCVNDHKIIAAGRRSEKKAGLSGKVIRGYIQRPEVDTTRQCEAGMKGVSKIGSSSCSRTVRNGKRRTTPTTR